MLLFQLIKKNLEIITLCLKRFRFLLHEVLVFGDDLGQLLGFQVVSNDVTVQVVLFSL